MCVCLGDTKRVCTCGHKCVLLVSVCLCEVLCKLCMCVCLCILCVCVFYIYPGVHVCLCKCVFVCVCVCVKPCVCVCVKPCVCVCVSLFSSLHSNCSAAHKKVMAVLMVL